MQEKANDNVLPIGSGRWTYTKEDFLTGTKPYEELFKLRNDPFRQTQTAAAMKSYAESVKVGKREFDRLWNGYRDSIENAAIGDSDHFTEFTGQAIELYTGQWIANDNGVGDDRGWACRHPVMPTGILTNLDTKTEKMRIAFRRGDYERWREIIVDRSTVASKPKIVGLADQGISVNSDTASALSRYLTETVDQNFDILPQEKSISRLGYVPGVGFSPYVDGLVFDGEDDFRDLYRSVSPQGDYGKWVAIAKECRQMSVTAKIMLAASFASPLLDILGVLPFFVHAWGGTGTGKTVALMLAASVWGDPNMGKMVSSFLSTAVGLEMRAAFLNHLPLCLDEFQLVRNRWNENDSNVYLLTQGTGKGRGKKGGGLQKLPTWKNCILTTGESPINGASAGGGAMNRVIEIECKSGEAVITDGQRVADAVKNNYGWAGREFITTIYESEEMQEKIKVAYSEIALSLSNKDTTEKQAMAAAAILIADRLISKTLFKDDPLTEEEIMPFLLTNQEVSVGQRGYDYLRGWTAANQERFESDQLAGNEPMNHLKYLGRFNGNIVQIIRTECDKALEEAGFQPVTVYSWMRDNGKLDFRIEKKTGKPKGFTKNALVNHCDADCIWMIMPERPDNDSDEELEIPDLG